MKIIYYGSSGCTLPTLKRLVLLGKVVGFFDRPAMTYDNWGTVGALSPMRRISPAFEKEEVKLRVFRPPSGPLDDVYTFYTEKDLGSGEFRKTFLEGLSTSDGFRDKFIQKDGKYSGGTGIEIVNDLIADNGLLDANIRLNEKYGDWFKTSTEVGRICTLRSMLVEASFYLTTVIAFSEKMGYLPVTDDIYLSKLLSLRMSDTHYVGSRSIRVPLLGIELIKSVIPDEVLQKLDFPDICNYRKKTKCGFRKICRLNSRNSGRFFM